MGSWTDDGVVLANRMLRRDDAFSYLLELLIHAARIHDAVRIESGLEISVQS